jgi:predicted  nucleic acid-binding Zn-ribbon protein
MAGEIDAAVTKTTVTLTADLVSVVTMAAALQQLGSLEKLIADRQDALQSITAMHTDLKLQVENTNAVLMAAKQQQSADLAAYQSALQDIRAQAQIAQAQIQASVVSP